MERVGDDLRHPHKAREHVLDEEQVHGAEDEAPEADVEPDHAEVVDQPPRVGGLGQEPEERRARPQPERGQRPQGHQDDLATQVVPHLDVLLVVVRGLIDVVISLGLEEEVPRLAAGHGDAPCQQRGPCRVDEQQHVGPQEAHRAQEMQRLVHAAVVVVAVVVPALHAQRLKAHVQPFEQGFHGMVLPS